MESLGIALSKADLRAVFNKFDNNQKNEILVDSFLDVVFKNQSSIGADRRDNAVRINDNVSDIMRVISRRAVDDIIDSTKSYLESSDAACLGKLFGDSGEDKGGKGLSLSKKQMRKCLAAVGTQLTDGDENMLFECLDYRGSGSVSVYDLVAYCYELVYRNDSEEVARVSKELFKNKNFPVKDVTRALVKTDSKRSGYLDHNTFEKLIKRFAG
jgi:Ca2+-binding EF-hand superfamily protein